MKDYISIIKKSSLFNGFQEQEILSIISCLSPLKKTYTKNEFVFKLKDKISFIGIVLKGSIYITKEDFLGNRTIISRIEEGQIFGEVYSFIETELLDINIETAEKTYILFLDIKKVMTVCSCVCEFHTLFIKNIIQDIAKKNIFLTKRLEYLSLHTTREKITLYLSEQAKKNKSLSFEIPFNRQQLADYLSVNRSALSKELCKMRDEKILTFNKNKFILKINNF